MLRLAGWQSKASQGFERHIDNLSLVMLIAVEEQSFSCNTL